MKKLFITLILFVSLLFPLKFLFANKIAEEKNTVEFFKTVLIQFKEKWEEKVLPIYKKIWKWLKENLWTKMNNLLNSEYKKRKDIIAEEFKKKKEQIKEGIQKSLEKSWEKILEKILPLLKREGK
jgi:predicted PurR-regulated permease PerM